LQTKIENLPRGPGVYLFKDARHEVIYVGKGKDLRARVRSYFQESGDEWRLISKRIDQVADVDVVVTDSEKEALLLENNFIKQFRPKYNVYFRDDKSFVSIKIDLAEPWPRPIVTRRLDSPKALYFGPYASAKSARKTMRVIQDVFPLRKCKISECMQRGRPCLYGEMGKCLAPCCADVTPEEYEKLIGQVALFLKGKSDDLLAELRREMAGASARMEYEKAGHIRDRIRAVETTLEAQHVASSAQGPDRDIFGLCTLEKHVAIAVLLVRNANIQDVGSYRFPAELDSEQSIFRSFLNQFYSQNRFIPDEVLVPVETEDAELLESWLGEKKRRKVRVVHPLRGAKRKLVELANENARQAERAATTDEEKRRLEMDSLQRTLGLSKLPRDIECFDISTLQGREAVGSMVVFRGGEPDKSSYRHYKIREVEGQDDFAMMREVVFRRFRRLADELSVPPDLVLVDGGLGQLHAAAAAIAAVGTERPHLVSLAKREEEVYVLGRAEQEPLRLPRTHPGLKVLQAVRDEAHRFAQHYHHLLRRKALFGDKEARRLAAERKAKRARRRKSGGRDG